MVVNYISNLDLSETSGGWTGINAAIYNQLSAHFKTKYVGPINPPSDYPAKLISKVQRASGNPGAFHFFSQRRLKTIAKLVDQQIGNAADCDFFHGSTPWVLFKPRRPYFTYVDTCFSTYMRVYHDTSKFLRDDLNRICDLETEWLSRATQVFFGTQWALDRVVEDYRISRSNLCVAGAGGSMTPPARDNYEGGLQFLFIALDFEAKGGHICTAAFQRVRKSYPDAELMIVGQRPPPEILGLENVKYAGFLRKSVPEELTRLQAIYSSAFALVHPTSMDIQPLVISEAGYFGCPAIAARSFGIPELIKDRVTGFLVDTPLNAEKFAGMMIGLCAERGAYLDMRRAVREHTLKNQTWSVVGDRVNGTITKLYAGVETAREN